MEIIDSDFLTFTKKIGENIDLIQGAGGNISVKDQFGCMYIKASGKWMSDALKENIFTRVDYKKINNGILQKLDNPVSLGILDISANRPSIETTLHALMNFKFVLHTHSTNVISYAVLQNAEKILSDKLVNFNWEFIDYNKPGDSLTYAILSKIKNDTNILILQNHGIVIGANNLIDLDVLVNTIEDILNKDIENHKITYDINTLSEISINTNYKPASIKEVHNIATNIKKIKLIEDGVLYPDYVVFLGSKNHIISKKDSLKEYLSTLDYKPIVIFVKGCGVLVKDNINNNALHMLIAFSHLIGKLSVNDQCRYLSSINISELLDWDLEKHRQNIAK
jgi:rhamnose utilization protein RhaD (predicted bifunctional aldolase and dehydrogenase)